MERPTSIDPSNFPVDTQVKFVDRKVGQIGVMILNEIRKH